MCGSDELKLEEIEAFDLVTDLASRANLLRPTNRLGGKLAQTSNIFHPRLTDATNVFGVVLYGLFERGDVSEGAQEQHHDVPLILDWRYVHQKPKRGPWDIINELIKIARLGIWDQTNVAIIVLFHVELNYNANNFYQREREVSKCILLLFFL